MVLVRLACTLLFCSTASAAQLLVDFEDFPEGTSYSEQQWEQEGFEQVAWAEGHERTFIDMKQAHGGKKSLRVAYPAGSFGPLETGLNTPLSITPGDEYYLSYWLMFDEQFSWGSANHGGKLPGLAGKGYCSGGETCQGSNGFTARYMWRTDGQAVIYLYHMDKPGTWGDDMPLLDATGQPLYFQKGEWINLVQRLRINTGDNRDGELQVWFNGVEALNRKGLRFVNNKSQIDMVYFSTFHGGGDDSWVPAHDSWIWFDDLEISKFRHESKDITAVDPFSIKDRNERFPDRQPASQR